jgi:predicted ATP-dependent serine protease
MVVFGEVSLACEIRSVSVVASRLFETENLGFKKVGIILLPKENSYSTPVLKIY